MTTYPNREHENADKAARRRAIQAASDLFDYATQLHRQLVGGQVPSPQMIPLQELTANITANLAVLETLRDVREWHAADQADVQERTALGDRTCADCRQHKYAHPLTEGHPHEYSAHPGWRGHDGFAVHRHEMTTGRAQWELMAGDGTPVTVVPQ